MGIDELFIDFLEELGVEITLQGDIEGLDTLFDDSSILFEGYDKKKLKMLQKTFFLGAFQSLLNAAKDLLSEVELSVFFRLLNRSLRDVVSDDSTKAEQAIRSLDAYITKCVESKGRTMVLVHVGTSQGARDSELVLFMLLFVAGAITKRSNSGRNKMKLKKTSVASVSYSSAKTELEKILNYGGKISSEVNLDVGNGKRYRR